MNILMITDNDPAGMGIAFTHAINGLTGHRCRLITTKTVYNFDFEKDLHIPDLNEEGVSEVEKLLHNADIFHFHILADENIQLGPFLVNDFIKGKSILHHHHGHPDFRSNPEKYRNKYRILKRKVLVSTPDLLRLIPEAKWQPNLVPINAPLYRPIEPKSNGKVKVCQSPTRKDLKNTLEFDSVVDSFREQYPNKVEKIPIENARHQTCLKVKQSCHIHFDHMQGYFGVSSLEGLSQGKPVIAGLDEWNLQCIKEFTAADEIPWQIARNEQELYHVMRRMVTDQGLRQEIGKQSRNFMEQHWNEKQALSVLMDVYQRLN